MRPGCQRCANSGAVCPGYTQDRKFLDEGARLRRKFKYDLPPEPSATATETTSSSSVQTATITPSASQHKSDSPQSPLRPELVDLHDQYGAYAECTKSGTIPEMNKACDTAAAEHAGQEPSIDNNFSTGTNILPRANDYNTDHIKSGVVAQQIVFNRVAQSDAAQPVNLGSDTFTFASPSVSYADEMDRVLHTVQAVFPLFSNSNYAASQESESCVAKPSEYETVFLLRHFSQVPGRW